MTDHDLETLELITLKARDTFNFRESEEWQALDALARQFHKYRVEKLKDTHPTLRDLDP